MADLLAWIQITRPINGIIAGLGVFLGALCLNFPLNIPPIWFCFLSMCFLALAGNVHNDICDLEVDKVNQPHRPLPSERISHIGAWFLTLNLTGYSLCFAWLAGPLQFYACFIMAVMLYLYNRFFKGWPVIGNLTVSLLCGLSLIFPGLGMSSFNSALWGAVAFAFFFTWIREMIKDLEDQEGDAKQGLKTQAILISEPLNFQIPKVIWVLFLGTLPLSYFFHIYGETFLLLSSIFVLLPSIVVLSKFSRPQPTHWKQQQKLIKWMMLGGMLSITADLLWPLS